MGTEFKYVAANMMDCMYAWWAKHHTDGVVLTPVEECADIKYDKEIFQREDGTYPEVISIMFDQAESPIHWYLIEGLYLTEFDPNTPGGDMLWEYVFNSEELTKKAIEEGQAVGRWDTLRQVMNMGQIAYMTKLNSAIAYLKQGFTEERETNVAEVLNMEYVKAARAILEKENIETK